MSEVLVLVLALCGCAVVLGLGQSLGAFAGLWLFRGRWMGAFGGREWALGLGASALRCCC